MVLMMEQSVLQTTPTTDQSTSLVSIIETHVREYYKAHDGLLPTNGVYQRLMREFELPVIKVTLEAVQGNQKKAAEILGINRNTLRRKILDLGLVRE